MMKLQPTRAVKHLRQFDRFGCTLRYLGLGLILVFNSSLTTPVGVCFTKLLLFFLART
jgi:hypothetical protein